MDAQRRHQWTAGLAMNCDEVGQVHQLVGQ